MKKVISVILCLLMVLTVIPFSSLTAFAATNGWKTENNQWVYYVDGVKVTNQWKKDSKGWCYLDANGYMATNKWVKDSVGWCYVGADGYCVTNKWVKDSHGWCYLDAGGHMATNKWIKDSVGWCYVGADGYCVTNKWVKDSHGWCYLDANGRMATNKWIKDSVGWCYVGADGYCVTNQWVQDSVGWCYIGKDGRMLTDQWVDDGENEYYVDSEGHRVDNPNTVSVAEAIKILNDITSKAANGSYRWTRKCWYTKPIDVGTSTNILNQIIQNVDKNASLDSVVGGFLGVTGGENDPAWSASVTNGAPDENMPEKYMLKAFALTKSDVMSMKVSGNKYMLQLASCNNPQRDNGNALHHVTNDFVTLDDVNQGITDSGVGNMIAVNSCDIDYSDILVEAEIEDGMLKNLSISYSMDVKELNLKISIVSSKGTGACAMHCTYSDFA